MNVGHTIDDPRYNPAALETHLASQLGNSYLSDVKGVELLVPSYAIGLPKEKQPAPMFFRSWQARVCSLMEAQSRNTTSSWLLLRARLQRPRHISRRQLLSTKRGKHSR